MKYHGNNPVGLALAADARGELRDALLRRLGEFQAQAEQQLTAASVPQTYRRHVAAAQCAALCATVVKEFHAVCVGTAAEQAG